MPKCIYKSKGTCYCSTSGHHCESVTDAICGACDANQEKITTTDKRKLQIAIQECIELMEMKDTEEALRILKRVLKI